jgi:site-specific recombinase XerD
MGKPRATLTIETYVCSALAFCLWLVERGDLAHFRVSEGAFPRTRSLLPSLIQPESFEQFVPASVLAATREPQAHQMLARDRAILWLFFETGISVSELCALRVSDLERETGTLRVWGQGGNERQMSLGTTCLNALLASLDQPRTARRKRGTGSSADNDLLFCSENGRPLTTNSLTLLFHRLRKRAGMPETTITPQILRHSFAQRYLQAGGDPRVLQELLGYKSMAQVRQYLRWYEQLLSSQTPKEAEAT